MSVLGLPSLRNLRFPNSRVFENLLAHEKLTAFWSEAVALVLTTILPANALMAAARLLLRVKPFKLAMQLRLSLQKARHRKILCRQHAPKAG